MAIKKKRKKSDLEILHDVFQEQLEKKHTVRTLFMNGMKKLDKRIPLSEEAIELCETVNRLYRLSNPSFIDSRYDKGGIKELLLEIAKLRKQLNEVANGT